jgi:hypothetical protein
MRVLHMWPRSFQQMIEKLLHPRGPCHSDSSSVGLEPNMDQGFCV